MRRSISYTEPKIVHAGQRSTWKFIYITAEALPKGTKVLFDLKSLGRETDWEIPCVDLKKDENTIWLQINDSDVISATHIKDSNHPSRFEFTLKKDVEEEDTLTIYIGSKSKTTEKALNKAQHFIQRRRSFDLYIDPTGMGEYGNPEVMSLDVKGNLLHNIRIIAPSIVEKNQRFDVIVRFEDCYGNLTGYTTESTLIELSHDQLRDNLNWKLFVPETGFINLPNLYFNEPGTYKFKLKNSVTEDLFFSAPVRCFQDCKDQICWGLLHGESEKYDSTENIESSLRNFRDDQSMQFYATSSFDTEQETSTNDWKNISAHVSEFNEEDRYACMLGFVWHGSIPSEGVKQIIYAKDNKPILRRKDTKSNSLKKIYKSHSPKDFISVSIFSMGKGYQYDFENYSQDFERVVEIYNCWGSSECTTKEGNLKPIAGKKGVQETKEGSIREALNNNCRFGFVAGGLDNRGFFGEIAKTDQTEYTSGMTAILSSAHSRDALFNALHARSCYATTGPRMIVTYTIANHGMGQELMTGKKPGLLYNRHIAGYIAGTSDLKAIDIIRNGQVIETIKPDSFSYELAFDDDEPLENVVISQKGKTPFAYYYIRVEQKDGHVAWGSPIWIDITKKEVVTEKTTKKKS